MVHRALVINCSAPHYNLGAQKLAAWLRSHEYEVTECTPEASACRTVDYALVCLSVIFSWHAPRALTIASRAKTSAEVWCGGPGMAALGHWWRQQTGLEATLGLDPRFERHRGQYRMTFASRGCPVGCWFCIVPIIEGRQFTLDWSFEPAPILCDNNLSALPADFQVHILQRYRELGMTLQDANSGFEPRAFTEDTYCRWKPHLAGPWRFAFDETREADDVRRMMHVLRGERARRKQVYTLVGNEPVAACYERAMQVIGWGGEPYCQYLRPLNWLGDPTTLRHRHDWTDQHGRDFCRFFNRHLWRSLRLSDYKPRVNEPEPFRHLERRAA